MRTVLLTATTMLVAAAAGNQPCPAGEKAKIHEVGKDGLTLQGRVANEDPKVKVIAFGKIGPFPAKLFLVKLSAGKNYRVSMDSEEIDSVLVVQNEAGTQLAWDDDSGGNLNSLVTLDALKDGTYKVFAGSAQGRGEIYAQVQGKWRA